MSVFWRRPHKQPRRSLALIRSMPLPIGVTTRSRTLRPAKRPASCPMFPGRSGGGAAVREGLFRKDEFRYDATSDTYLCPAGQRLEPRYHTAARNLKKVDVATARLAEPARF